MLKINETIDLALISSILTTAGVLGSWIYYYFYNKPRIFVFARIDLKDLRSSNSKDYYLNLKIYNTSQAYIYLKYFDFYVGYKKINLKGDNNFNQIIKPGEEIIKEIRLKDSFKKENNLNIKIYTNKFICGFFSKSKKFSVET